MFEKLPRFFQIEPQRRCVDLDHLVLRAQAGKRQDGFHARTNHQMELWRGMFEQKRQRVMYLRIGDAVIIIQE